MKLSDFDFELPAGLIAQSPARPRDHARLLVYDRQTKKITDDYFYNLDKHLHAGTTLVLNNSKVEKCRLRFGKTELFVTETINPTTVKALVRPGRRFKLHSIAKLPIKDGGLEATTVEIDEQGIRTINLSLPIDDPALDQHRLTPLPPYIAQDETLAEDYQTVYSRFLGSKAAPTAGLHFTSRQLKELRKAYPVAELTLHVGLGTFAPIKTTNIDRHKMHHEWYEINKKTADILNSANHVTAVGTTSARTLESLRRPFGPNSSTTNIFIKPGYQFRNVDSLITNFHLPKSTLLLLVSALMGSADEMQRVYKHAIDNSYRFYSFGDAMLIL